MFKNTAFWDKLAIRCYRKLIKMNDKVALIHNNLGLAYLRTQKINQAIKSFKKAIRCDEKYMEPYYHLGKVYHDLGERKKALSYYTQYEVLNAQKKGKPKIVAELVAKLRVGET